MCVFLGPGSECDGAGSDTTGQAPHVANTLEQWGNIKNGSLGMRLGMSPGMRLGNEFGNETRNETRDESGNETRHESGNETWK